MLLPELLILSFNSILDILKVDDITFYVGNFTFNSILDIHWRLLRMMVGVRRLFQFYFRYSRHLVHTLLGLYMLVTFNSILDIQA